eukprot:NODE_6235_length_1691_cov_5.512148.p2 GENE.NODE_6235_length_1691_cov_5.512148~~NODE_6235_length_1691_cov_5.512148.p2  ORF type:complete len:200 (+),score=55.17 NODE_6235_length_1691_cov_5.512148:677-1276(+)
MSTGALTAFTVAAMAVTVTFLGSDMLRKLEDYVGSGRYAGTNIGDGADHAQEDCFECPLTKPGAAEDDVDSGNYYVGANHAKEECFECPLSKPSAAEDYVDSGKDAGANHGKEEVADSGWSTASGEAGGEVTGRQLYIFLAAVCLELAIMAAIAVVYYAMSGGQKQGGAATCPDSAEDVLREKDVVRESVIVHDTVAAA